MNFTEREYKAEINQSVEWKKYASPAHLETLLDQLVEFQPLPSQSTITRFLDKLKFSRTDGGSAETDRLTVVNAAQKNFDAAVAEAGAPPLTASELREFASLGPDVLQKRYYAEDCDYFRIRYNKAAREHGFRIPGPPKLSPQAAAAAVPAGQELVITVQEYRNTPARIVAQRCLREPRYHAAVLRLAAQGLI